MLTGKQRAALRGIANAEPTIFQIGKSGITDNTIEQIDNALSAREIVKLGILKNSLESPREACEHICGRTGAEPVQVIGGRFVIYRESKKNKKIFI